MLAILHIRRLIQYLTFTNSSARRNDQGQLEPDAEEDVVQNSLGFGGYELAPKAELRGALKDSSDSTKPPTSA